MTNPLHNQPPKQPNESARESDASELTEQEADFLDELHDIVITHNGHYPLTVRHIANRLVPDSIDETTMAREARVFKLMRGLESCGLLAACQGIDSRTYDGPDPLPTYYLVNPPVLEI